MPCMPARKYLACASLSTSIDEGRPTVVFGLSADGGTHALRIAEGIRLLMSVATERRSRRMGRMETGPHVAA